MASQVTCECSHVALADTDDDVVATVREPVASDDPELLDTVTEDVIRAWVQIVP